MSRLKEFSDKLLKDRIITDDKAFAVQIALRDFLHDNLVVLQRTHVVSEWQRLNSTLPADIEDRIHDEEVSRMFASRINEDKLWRKTSTQEKGLGERIDHELLVWCPTAYTNKEKDNEY